MNNKIKQLAEQVGWREGNILMYEEDMEKFSESIIKETIKIIQATAAESVDLDRTLVENVSWTVNDIKKHFGVEE